MTETNNSLETQKERFKQSLTQMLQDSRISPKEARELVTKFQLEKQEILEITQQQLQSLQEQFWSELWVNNFDDYMNNQASKYLNTQKPDKELLYDGLTDFESFEKTGAVWVDLKNPKKPENVSEADWKSAQTLLEYAKHINVNEGKISFTKEKGVVLERDTSGSNLYVKLDGNQVVVSGQNDGVFFVEKLSKDDFASFVEYYDKVEFKRVLEMIGFTGGLTMGGILSFSLRTWIWWLLWYLWTWFWVYKWYQVFKSYHLSKNEAMSVLQEYKWNVDVIKSYLYLVQSGYVVWYKNWKIITIDNEELTGDELQKKTESIDVGHYQLLRWLKEQGFSPKKSAQDTYELDMAGLFDTSPLRFNNGKIEFSTTYFEKAMKLEFSSPEEAFSKIQTINEVILLEMELKWTQNTENSFDFNNKWAKIEAKIQRLKHQIIPK